MSRPPRVPLTCFSFLLAEPCRRLSPFSSDTLDKWAAKHEDHTDFSLPYASVSDVSDEMTTPTDKEDLRVYWQTRNSHSIDGLPSFGTFFFDEKFPPSTKLPSCATSRPPKPTITTLSRLTSRLPSASSFLSHLAVASAGGGLVYALDHGLVDGKMVVGLVGATGAWVVGNLVGVPVLAPCCAMGV